MATDRIPLRTVDPSPNFLDRLLRRRPRRDQQVEMSSVARPRAGSLPVTDTIDLFVASGMRVPEIVSIRARSQGEHVHFLIQSTDIWHHTIDKLEPMLVDLELERGAAFDYSVIRPGLDADPPGYLDVFLRG